MTQEEQIEKAANDFHNHEILHSNGGIWEDGYREGCALGFVAGAHWALSNQWISVDDELPEKDGIYFVMANSMLPLITIFNHTKGTFELEPYRSYNITHWMPIPKLNN